MQDKLFNVDPVIPPAAAESSCPAKIRQATADVVACVTGLFQRGRIPLSPGSKIIERVERFVPIILESYDAGHFDRGDRRANIQKAVFNMWNLDEPALLTLGNEAVLMEEIIEGGGEITAQSLTAGTLKVLFPDEFSEGQKLDLDMPARRELPDFKQFLALDPLESSQVSNAIAREIEKYLKGYLAIVKAIKPLRFEKGRGALSRIIIDLIENKKRISEVADQISAVIYDMVPESWFQVLLAENLPTELGNLARDLSKYALCSRTLIEMQSWVDEFEADLPAVVFTYRTTDAKRQRLPEHLDKINELARKTVQRRMLDKKTNGARQNELLDQGKNPMERQESSRATAPGLRRAVYQAKPSMSSSKRIGLGVVVVVLLVSLFVLGKINQPTAEELNLYSLTAAEDS